MGRHAVTALRIERVQAISEAPEGFDALGLGLHGHADSDPSDGLRRLVARRGSDAVARVSVQLVEGLKGAAGVSGVIGHYAAADLEAGRQLLIAAREELMAEGCAHVLGPMNGNTWRRYRVALRSEPGDPVFNPPVFLGEPTNPPEYASHFEAAGFEMRSRYESRIASTSHPSADAVEARVAEAASKGLHLRALDMDRFDHELRAMFDLTVEAFADNLFYTPIEFKEFNTMYATVRPILDPSLVFLLEDEAQNLAGYIFGYTDPLSDRGSGPTRGVAKTMAVTPSRQGQGLGALLFDRFALACADAGRPDVIHALMHVDNFSRRLSTGHASKVFRRYALYEWSP